MTTVALQERGAIGDPKLLQASLGQRLGAKIDGPKAIPE